MIEEAVKIHDKTQFEIKLNYKFERKKKDASYEVDTYFFLPNSLGINKQTFRKVNFYDSLQSYIRFKTPVYSLEQITAETKSPLALIKNAYRNIVESPNSLNSEEYELQTKLFCSIFASSIRDNTAFIINRDATYDLINLINKQIEELQKIAKSYRALGEIISVPKVNNETFSVHLFGDEYISLVIEKYSYKLLEYLKTKDSISKDDTSLKLLGLIQRENDYRINHNYPSISNKDSDNEELMFRFGVLKKYFDSALFLNRNIEKEGRLIEQIIFSVAAGLAMLVATAIAFYSQSFYGSLTLQLFIVLVVSYMLKDRLKEMTRVVLSKRISKNLFDNKIKLYLEDKYKIGVIRGSFNFIKMKTVPKEILSYREINRPREFDSKFSREKVILYRKKIILSPKTYYNHFHEYKIEAVRDIFRFDVSRFLKKMDNPRKPIFSLTPNGYKKVFGRRVYHVNLIIKYVQQGKEIIHRFRLVLTRNGIKRIEPVVIENF